MHLVYQGKPRTVTEAGRLPYVKAWVHSAGGKHKQTLSKQYWALSSTPKSEEYEILWADVI